MGYDMRMRKTPPPAPEHDIEQAREAAEAAMEAALKARREGGHTSPNYLEKVRTANHLHSQLMALEYPGEFRLNTSGMSVYLGAMFELGMMHHSNAPKIDWDQLPHDYETREEEAAYYEVSDRLTGQHGDNRRPTIPSHKFSSNDGWFITPEEIRAALEAWESFEAGTPNGFSADTLEVVQTDYWGKWIDYLRLATDHDGFRVH